MLTFRVKILRFDPEETITAKYLSSGDLDRNLYSVLSDVLEPEENLDAKEIHCALDGVLLDINKKLSDLGITEHSLLTLFVKPKVFSPKSPEVSGAAPHIPTETEISCLAQTENQSKFAKFISDGAWFQNTITKYPEIGADKFVFSLVQDPKMLIALLKDNQSLTNAFMAHPSLALVIKQLIPVLQSYRNSDAYPPEIRYFLSRFAPTMHQSQRNTQEESNSGGGSSNPENESSSATAQHSTTSSHSRHRGGQRQTANIRSQDIFTPYVGQAYPQTSESNVAPAQPSNSGQRITASALSQAIAAARTDLPTTTSEQTEVQEPIPEVSNEPPASRWALQLSQLAEMGITDEASALHALEATNGDLNMAIQILFGGEI